MSMNTNTAAGLSGSLPGAFQPLRDQLLAAARSFTADSSPLGELLGALVDDVERADAEPLEIFPVCHHSPASALHLIRRIERKAPRVIFIELCEDLRPLVEKLRDCKLPVALQGYAGRSQEFPESWVPLGVVAPLTEFSAEYQAIVYALEHPEVDLVFVDRSVDHLFQWMPRDEDALERRLGTPPEAGPDGEEGPSHVASVGIQVGGIEPTFPLFLEFLLANARVRYFAEWWDQFVEQPVLASDYATYRQVMFLIGSLFRRLGRREEDHDSDRLRERFMWTRMKEYLSENQIDPREALHICGAIHAVSDVAEYGAENPLRWEIPTRTTTPWLYGVIPSSYAAIDAQFQFPPGTVTLADALWDKGRRQLGVRPFALTKADASPKTRKDKTRSETTSGTSLDLTPAPTDDEAADRSVLLNYLVRPPAPGREDEDQLTSWCVGIVALARKHGYLSTTADSIAIYQTAVLLAQVRERLHPTAYDFRDAAITCLEKDRTPRKRDIARLCDILLGGDRIGQVGFTSLPPLAQDVYERLAPLRINLQATSIQRALLDLRQRPELRVASDLLWKLAHLLGPQRIVRPIMGQKVLGQVAIQESWDVAIGKNQTPLLMLAYEGVTVEQVLEKRLRAKAFAPEADAATALAAAEECLLYLESARLTEQIGDHAVGLLVQETGAQSARECFERIRRLVHHYRSTAGGLPGWIKSFVATGYSHYSTLLPRAFEDDGTAPEQVAGMLAFIFTLESLALSLGCRRSELIIAVRQSGPVTQDPNKRGLLWTSEWLLGLRSLDEIRGTFDELLANPMALASFPAHVSGFLMALQFTPLVGPLAVEVVSRAFERLPNRILLPWLPGLILMLRQHGESVLPVLLKEVSTTFPGSLEALSTWRAPWEQTTLPPEARPSGPAVPPREELTEGEAAVAGLLASFPASAEALARSLGIERLEPLGTADQGPSLSMAEEAVRSLLRDHSASAEALARLLRR